MTTESTRHTDLAWIIVNYFDDQESVAFIREQLLAQKQVDCTIVLANNGSHAPEALRSNVQQLSEKIHFVEVGRNAGYFGAAEAARQYLISHGISFRYFLLSNFDLVLPSTTFAADFLAHTAQHQWHVAGPQILAMPHEKPCNPMYRERLSPAHLQRLLRVTSWYPLYAFYQILHKIKRRSSAPLPAESSACYAVHGSMMLFHHSFFAKGGTLSYGGFLYGEEIDVAEQCRQLGCTTGFVHSLLVEHHEHINTGSFKSRKHMHFLHDSLRYIHSKYYA